MAHGHVTLEILISVTADPLDKFLSVHVASKTQGEKQPKPGCARGHATINARSPDLIRLA